MKKNNKYKEQKGLYTDIKIIIIILFQEKSLYKKTCTNES